MKLNDIIGHNEQVEHMVKAFRSGRLAHAYLFYGPDGIGKKSAALALTNFVFCENNADGDDSCGYCAACRKLEADNHPDLITVRPDKSWIKIDMVRELQKKLHFGKYDADFKFCIIDDADRMRVEAANALLKTLEEPSANTIIILVTSKVNMLLPTIVSRCQKVRFNPLTTGEVKGELIRRYALGNEDADIISTFLQGSFAKLTTDDFSTIIELRQKLAKQVRDISLNNLSGIIKFSADLASSDKDLLVETVEIIKTFYRDAAMLKSGVDDLINKDIRDEIQKMAQAVTLDELFEKINIMNQIQRSIMGNVNKKLAMESMLIELSA